MAIVRDPNGYTEQQLIAERLVALHAFKKWLKKDNKNRPHKKRDNFKWFKTACRDRKHDAIAGHVKDKNTGLYHWLWG